MAALRFPITSQLNGLFAIPSLLAHGFAFLRGPPCHPRLMAFEWTLITFSGKYLVVLLFGGVFENCTFMPTYRLQRGMCSYFCDTLQVRPCKLDDGIHAINGHSRIYTGLFISSILTFKESVISF
jgi:hypothetical protein